MSTTTTEADCDRWIQMPATWKLYLGLLEARGERSRPKYTFIDGRLTVMSPGHNHEETKKRLGSLLEEILIELDIDFHSCGGVTLLKEKGSRAGTEGDETYYLTNIKRVRGKKDLLMGEDPPPDLVIEVVVSHAEDDAVEAYRRIGVREIWVPKNGNLTFLILGPDGQYSESSTSGLLPFLGADDLISWVYRQDIESDAKLRKRFRAWVDETLVPRHHGAAGD